MSVYRVGVEMTMANGLSPVLGVIMRDLIGVDKKVTDVSQGFKAWHAALGGTLALMGAGGILGAMAKLVEHGRELVHVQEQMTAAGVTAAENAEATAKSWQVAMRFGLPMTKVLADIKELRLPFGSTEHAIDFIEPLEKMRVVLNSVSEGTGNKAKDAVYEMARAGELKGLQNPDDFVRYFDGMTKAISASGGKIDPAGYMQATQYGKIAAKGWSEEFYTQYLPSMMQELRPSGAGTALMSMYSSFLQGNSTEKSVRRMDDLGLIADQSKVHTNKQGIITGFDPGALADSATLQTNPFKWAQTTLKDLLEQKLGRTYEAGDSKVLELLSGLTGNRNSATALAALTLEGGRINKDAGLIRGAKGLDAADGLLQRDPTAIMNSFHAAWDNLLTSLGSPLVETAMKMMSGLTEAMNTMTAWAVANPEGVKLIGAALAGIAAGLAALGAVLIGGALIAAIGPGGLLIVGLTAAGAAITAFTATIENLGAKVSAVMGAVGNWINSGGVENGGNRYRQGAPGSGGRGGVNAVPPPSSVPGKQSNAGDIFLDGAKVGRHVAKAMADGSVHSASGAYADRRRQWMDPDVSYS